MLEGLRAGIGETRWLGFETNIWNLEPSGSKSESISILDSCLNQYRNQCQYFTPFKIIPGSYRVLPPVFIELLLGLAGEGALWTRVRPLPAMVHLVLFQLPFGPEHLLADRALLRILRVVNLQVKPEGAQLFETLFALWTLKDFVVSVNLENANIAQ